MGEVVQFPGSESWELEFTTQEENEIPLPNIFGPAQEAITKNLVVLGITDEDSYYFASSSKDASKILLLLEAFKKTLIDAIT